MGHQVNKKLVKTAGLILVIMLFWLGLFMLENQPLTGSAAVGTPEWTGETKFDTYGEFKLNLPNYFKEENTSLTYYTSDADNLTITIENEVLIVTPDSGFVGQREFTVYASDGVELVEQKIILEVLAQDFGIPEPEIIQEPEEETQPEENITEPIEEPVTETPTTLDIIDQNNTIKKDNKYYGKRITQGNVSLEFTKIEKTQNKLILEFTHNSDKTETFLIEGDVQYTFTNKFIEPGQTTHVEINLIQGIVPKFRLSAGIKPGFSVTSQWHEILEMGKTIPQITTNGQSQLIDRNDEKLDLEITKDSGKVIMQGVGSESIKSKIDSIEDSQITTDIIATEPIEIEQATITLPKTGPVNVIMECSNINVDALTCPSWQKTNIPFTQNSTHITFTVDHFSGYGGAELEVINLQSYPTVGGNWTVEFTTTGTANLTITAVDSTTWSDSTEENVDLKFLELKCNNTILSYTWLNNSVFYQDYFCNQTGSETSKVLTTGKHTLKFQFGDDIDYAYNDAAANLSCVVRNDSCSGNEIGIMRMSNQSNAHAALINDTDYTWIVCCEDKQSRNILTNSSGTNIVNLSAAHDAHAEVPGTTDYDQPVYLGANIDNITCTYENVSGSCSGNSTCLMTLSNTTDAHVADCVSDPYNLSVCCDFQINDVTTDVSFVLNSTLGTNTTDENLHLWASSSGEAGSITYWGRCYSDTNKPLKDWEATYDLSADLDYFYDVAVDNDNNIIACGVNSSAYDNGTLIKVDKVDGSIIWVKRVDAPDWPILDCEVKVDSQNNIVSGWTKLYLNGSYLAKFNSSGDLIWSELHDASSDSRYMGVEVDDQDNVYFATGTGNNLGGVPLSINVSKLDSSGSHLWDTVINVSEVPKSSASSYVYDVAVDSQYNVYVLGGGTYWTQGKQTIFKLNSSGDVLAWINFTSYYGDPCWGSRVISSFDTDSDDNLIGAGSRFCNVPYLNYGTYQNKVNSSDGSVIWSDMINSPADESFYDVVVDKSTDNSYSTGYTTVYGSGTRIFTVGYNSSGDPIWNITQAGSTTIYGYGIDLGNATEKNLVVAGRDYDRGIIIQYLLNSTVAFNVTTSIGQTVNLYNVSANETLIGENWICEINYSSSFDSGFNTSNNLTIIGNDPPTTVDVILNSSTGNDISTDDLTCYAYGYDGEQSTLTAYYNWYNDSGLVLSGSTGGLTANQLNLISTLSSGNTSSNETWTCEVFFGDGLKNGTAENDSLTLKLEAQCGDTLYANQQYVVIADTAETDSSGHCFDIAGDNIELDCLGNYVSATGSAKDTGYAVYSTTERKNFTMKNCFVQDFNYGAYYSLSNSTFYNNTFNSTRTRAIYIASSSCKGDNFTANTFMNIFEFTSSTAIYLTGNTNMWIDSNNFSNNDRDIHLHWSGTGTIKNNIIDRNSNADAGIYSDPNSASTNIDYIIENNTISNVGTSGSYGYAYYFQDAYSNFTFVGNNMVDGENASEFYHYGKENLVIDSLNHNSTVRVTNIGQLALFYCNNVTVQNSNFTNHYIRNVYFYETDNSTFADNFIGTRGACGNNRNFDIRYSDYNNFTGNNMVENAACDYIVYMTDSDHNNFNRNNMLSGKIPIHIYDCSNTTLEYNNITSTGSSSNDQVAVKFSGGSINNFATVKYNNITGGYNGLQLIRLSNATIAHNNISNAAVYNVYTSMLGGDNIIANNSIYCPGTTATGILIGGQVDTITQNNISGCRYGIYPNLQSSGIMIIKENNITDPDDWGIYFGSDLLDGDMLNYNITRDNYVDGTPVPYFYKETSTTYSNNNLDLSKVINTGFTLVGSKDMTIINNTIHGDDASSSYGLTFFFTNNTNLTNNRIHDFYRTIGTPYDYDYSVNNYIAHNLFNSSFYGAYYESGLGDYKENYTWYNNTILDATVHGFYISCLDGVHENVSWNISGNKFYNIGTNQDYYYPLYLSYCGDVNIENNVINNSYRFGLRLDNNLHDVTVKNNNITYFRSFADAYGIYMGTNCQDNNITGNLINDSTGNYLAYGMYLGGIGANNQITYNQIYNSNYGIYYNDADQQYTQYNKLCYNGQALYLTSSGTMSSLGWGNNSFCVDQVWPVNGTVTEDDTPLFQFKLSNLANYTTTNCSALVNGTLKGYNDTLGLDQDNNTIQSSTLTVGQHELNYTCSNIFDDYAAPNSIIFEVLQGNEPPVVNNVILNSSLGTNYTHENLAVYYNATDVDNDTIYNTTAWYNHSTLNYNYSLGVANPTTYSRLYMPFDDPTYNNATFAIDYSPGSHNGTVSGADYLASGGHNGQGAYNFTGSDYIDLGTQVGNYTSSQPFTVSAWIYHQNDVNRVIIGRMTAGSVGWHIRMISGNKLRMIVANSGASYSFSDSSALSAGWHHIVGIWNGTKCSTYIDGLDDSSRTGGGTMGFSASENLYIGKDNSQNPFIGQIDSVKIYDGILTDEEIKALYTDTTTPNILDSSLTALGDIWQACITSYDGIEYGTTNCSNNLTVLEQQFPPVVNNVVLNSTLGTNITDENLTVYFNANDANNDPLTNQTKWYKNQRIYPALPPDVSRSDLLLLLPFENYTQPSDTLKDYSPLNNRVNNNGQADWHSGIDRNSYGAYNFSSDYLNTSQIHFNDHFTFIVWVNSDVSTQTGYGRIIETIYSNHFYLGLNAAGTQYQVIINNGAGGCGGYGCAYGGSVSQGVWEMLAATYNGSLARLYVNGTNVANDTFNNPGTYTDDVKIGRHHSTAGWYWDGKLDDVMIFNTTLTPDQIQNIYNNISTDIILAEETEVDDTWSACITADDGTYQITNCSNNLTVLSGNEAPNTTFIMVNATSINNVTSDNLTCYANATDPENDTLTFHYGWYRNGMPQSNLEGSTASGLASGELHLVSTVTSNYTFKDDVWSCFVKADDGTENETGWEDSNNITIRNTAPTQDSAWIAAHQATGLTVDENLVNYWQFEKGSNKSGTAIDSVGISNGTIYMHEPAHTDDGRIGSAYHFDGSSTYSESYLDNSLNVNTGNFTYSAWFKADSIGVNIIVRSAWTGFNTGASVYLSGNNIYCAGRTSTGSERAASNAFTDTTKWHHVVCVRENQVMNGYLDGVAFTTNGVTGANANLTSHQNTVIGASTDYTYPFNGSIDDVLIFNRSLNSTEANELYLDGQINASSIIKSDQDLAVASNNTADVDVNETISRIYNWYRNGTSITVLNMPFESNKSDITLNLIRDYSPHSNNGTLGAGTPAYVPTWTDQGRNGLTGAYNFDGDDWINISHDSSLDVGGSLTVGVWVKAELDNVPDGQAHSIVEKWEGGSVPYPYIIRYGPNERVQFADYNGTGGGNSVVSTSLLNDSQWHYVVGVRNIETGRMLLYFDGMLEDNNSWTNRGSVSNTHNLAIGSRNGIANTFFNGIIDEVRIYNRSLSSEQIAAHYNLEYNRIVNQEIIKKDQWFAEVTLNDLSTNTDSNTKQTRNTTIKNKEPTQARNPHLNSSLNTDTSNESLRGVPRNVFDNDNDPVKNISNWYVNDVSMTLLNMPFEGNSSKDYSSHNNHGTVVNATWNLTGGYDGRGAYDFDGDKDYITLPNKITFSNASFSIGYWLYLRDDGSRGGFFQRLNSGNYRGVTLGKGANNIISASVIDSSGNSAIVSTSQNLNTWVRYDMTYNNNTKTITLYKNGVQVNQTTNAAITNNFGESTHHIPYIMARDLTGADMNGIMDELTIYNRSLSSQQIFAVYQNNTDYIAREETVAGEDWSVCFTPNDGYDDGKQQCSNDITILTSLPDGPTPLIPLNNQTIITPSPEFIWENSYDADADIITYHILVDDNPAFDAPEINVSNIPETGSTNTSYNATVELTLDKTYYWKVRGNDSTGFSGFSEVFNFTLVSQLSINLTRNIVNFSQMYINQMNDTSDNNPLPFLVENTGNLFANITINGSPLFQNAQFPGTNYQFKIDTNETNSFNYGQSTTTYVNMTNVSTRTDVAELDWHYQNDTAEIDINITVPGDEPEGVKSATVTLTAS